MRANFRAFASALAISAACALHLAFSAATIQRSNQDFRASDQGAEMWLAELARNDPYPMRTDGVRHPLFSWCAKWIFSPDKNEQFTKGKWLNTILATIFLAGLGLSVSRWLDPLATANLLLLSSLGALVVRGTYFQPEPLYYALFFGCCVLGWKILAGTAGPRWYPAFGLLCGAAFLAKPSLGPFLGAFCLGVGAKFAAGRFCPMGRGDLLWAAAGAALFAASIIPLGLFSKQHFGKPFFNYPQVWMWMDDFDTEAWPWQDRHPGRAQLEKLAPEETPSAGWYFRRHTPADAFARLKDGTSEVVGRFFFPEPKRRLSHMLWRSSGDGKKWEQPIVHRGIYLGALIALAIALAAMAPKFVVAGAGQPGFVGVAVFAAAAISVYTLLYGWYWPIGRGDRFMASLWVPCIFAAVWGCSLLKTNSSAPRPASLAYWTIHGTILASLLLQCAATTVFFLSGGALVTRN